MSDVVTYVENPRYAHITKREDWPYAQTLFLWQIMGQQKDSSTHSSGSQWYTAESLEMNLHLGQEDQVAQEVLGVLEFVWIHLQKVL